MLAPIFHFASGSADATWLTRGFSYAAVGIFQPSAAMKLLYDPFSDSARM